MMDRIKVYIDIDIDASTSADKHTSLDASTSADKHTLFVDIAPNPIE